jgi:hypothetical protein
MADAGGGGVSGKRVVSRVSYGKRTMYSCNNGNSDSARRSEARSEEFVFTRHVVGIITHDTAFTLALCWLPTVASKHLQPWIYHKNPLHPDSRKSVQLCDVL